MYNDPVLVTLHGGGADSMTGVGGVEEVPIASS